MAECPTCGDLFKNKTGMRMHHSKVHGEKAPKTCVECGQEFTPTEYSVDRCSQECAAESLRDRVEVTCSTCGERFEAHTHRADSAKYCSEKCRDAYVDLECDWCGGGFEVRPSRDDRRFCGEECFASWRDERMSGDTNPNWVEKVNVTCHNCGEGMKWPPWRARKSKRAFCSEACRAEWLSKQMTGEDHPRWSGGESPYGAGWNKRKRETVRKRDGHTCQDCGLSQSSHVDEFGQKLHVHHIIPAREFDNAEARNAVDNLVTLCRSCHLGKWEKLTGLRPDANATLVD